MQDAAKKPFTILVLDKDVNDFIFTYHFLRHQIDNKLMVPYEDVKELFRCMRNVDQFASDLSHEEALRISDVAGARIIPDKNLSVRWRKVVVSEGKEKKVAAETTEILYRLSLQFLIYKMNEGRHHLEKAEAIEFFFALLNKAFKPLLSRKEQAQFKSYKPTIYAAILTEASGIKISNKILRTNKDYYQAGNDVLKQLKD